MPAKLEDLTLAPLDSQPPEDFATLLNRAVAYSTDPNGREWKHESLAGAVSGLGLCTISPSTVKSHLSGASPEPKRIVLWSYCRVLGLPGLYFLDPRVTVAVDERRAFARERPESN